MPAECTPTAQSGGPYSTPEGTNATLSGSGSTKGSHASAGAITSYNWDLDNDGQYDDATGVIRPSRASGTMEPSRSDCRSPTRTVRTDTDTTTVTVTNVAPTVTLQSISSTPENSPITLTGTVSDPGWLEGLTATVNWGDGAGTQGLTGTLENTRPNATLSFSVPHTYGDDGSFTITVCGATMTPQPATRWSRSPTSTRQRRSRPPGRRPTTVSGLYRPRRPADRRDRLIHRPGQRRPRR